jgi:hypothetical protein
LIFQEFLALARWIFFTLGTKSICDVSGYECFSLFQRNQTEREDKEEEIAGSCSRTITSQK